jgi:homoserine kinase type II
MPSRPRAEFEKDELDAVLGRYDLGAIERVEPLNKGSRKAPKVVITSDRGRYLLKRRAPGRDNPAKVAFSHGVQKHLARSGFPLPLLQPTRDGETMLSMDDRIYEMFEHVSGEPFDRSPGAAQDAGRVLGLFHKALEGYGADWEPSRSSYHDNNGVRSGLNGLPSIIGLHDSVAGQESELHATVNGLYDAYDRAATAVEAAGFRGWPSQIVHTDWHPGNMLFVGGRVSAVIDYDSLHWLPCVTDVANAVLQFSIVGEGGDPLSWPAAPDETRVKRFLAGYTSVHSLDDEERRLMPYMMIEALIAEAVCPVAATGSFGHMEGYRFLRMVLEKARWLQRKGSFALSTR